MMNIWVIVANARRARIFLTKNSLAGTLVEIKTLVHPELGLPEREWVSDAPGRAFDSMGEGRHAMEPETSLKSQEMDAFSRQVAENLKKAYEDKNFDKLVIVAAPAFLGYLRKHISPRLTSTISLEIDKDLTQLPPTELRAQLPYKLTSTINTR